ncbi:hypothetical protein [uncultured Jatrophihabitans sp.]|uniref:hypothetical protein n=1 Tax=uncultured Jatrophihabitans sp. TaxID=1610747 RepID=UPI0035C99E2B
MAVVTGYKTYPPFTIPDNRPDLTAYYQGAGATVTPGSVPAAQPVTYDGTNLYAGGNQIPSSPGGGSVTKQGVINTGVLATDLGGDAAGAASGAVATQAALDAGTYASSLGRLATATTAVAPTVGKNQPYSTASGPLAPTLPPLTSGAVAAALAAGQLVRLKITKSKLDTNVNSLTLTCSGSDTFESPTQTTMVLTLPGERVTLIAGTIPGGSGPVWIVEDHDVTPLSVAPSVDQLALTRLERQTRQKLDTYNKATQARAADATVFTETWADLTHWNAASGSTVASNRYYGQPGVGRAISVPTGGRFFARATLHLNGSTTKYAYLGISNAAAGSVPVAGDTNGFYVGISSSGVPSIYRGSNISSSQLTTTTVSSSTPATGDYVATVAIDETTVSLALHSPAGLLLIMGSVPRSALPSGPVVNNLALSVNDTTGPSTGMTWGPLFTTTELAPPPAASQAPGGASLLGATNPWTFQRLTSGGIRHMIQVPGQYDPRVPAPVLLFLHQAQTGHADNPYVESRMANVTAALTAAGYIIASSDNGTSLTGGSTTTPSTGNDDNYANQTGQDDYAALLEWVRQHFNTGAVFLLGPSLGGEFIQNILAARAIGGIAAAASICPSTDLNIINSLAGYYGPLRAAYGAASDGSDFASKIVGYNPIDHPDTAYRGVPQRFYVGSNDTTAPPAQHVTPLVARIAQYAPECAVTTLAVGHLDATLYQGSDLVSFFGKYL